MRPPNGGAPGGPGGLTAHKRRAPRHPPPGPGPSPALNPVRAYGLDMTGRDAGVSLPPAGTGKGCTPTWVLQGTTT
ncbi:hypothetical protein GCM10023083_63310 [Streptomyces phyllanthi]